MSTITINRVLVEPANYFTNEERKENARKAAMAALKVWHDLPPEETPKDTGAVPLPAEKVTGTCALHVDPAASGAPEVPVDRPDLLGHRWKNGVCLNEGCGAKMGSVPWFSYESMVADGAAMGWKPRCVGEKRPAFIPRVVEFCPHCTLAIGAGCVCGKTMP